MRRLCETEGLTESRRRSSRRSASSWRQKIIPVATELEHRDEYPTEIVEEMKELGVFGLMIPEEYGGLGESLLTYALVVEEIARGWMSVSRHHQHPLHRRLHAACSTAPRSRSEVPAADGDRRGARRVLDVGARLRLRRRGDQDQGQEDRRRLRDHRPEDVADQRGLVQPGRGPGEDRRGRDSRLQEHDDVPRGEDRRASARSPRA